MRICYYKDISIYKGPYLKYRIIYQKYWRLST